MCVCVCVCISYMYKHICSCKHVDLFVFVLFRSCNTLQNWSLYLQVLSTVKLCPGVILEIRETFMIRRATLLLIILKASIGRRGGGKDYLLTQQCCFLYMVVLIWVLALLFCWFTLGGSFPCSFVASVFQWSFIQPKKRKKKKKRGGREYIYKRSTAIEWYTNNPIIEKLGYETADEIFMYILKILLSIIIIIIILRRIVKHYLFFDKHVSI